MTAATDCHATDSTMACISRTSLFFFFILLLPHSNIFRLKIDCRPLTQLCKLDSHDLIYQPTIHELVELYDLYQGTMWQIIPTPLCFQNLGGKHSHSGRPATFDTNDLHSPKTCAESEARDAVLNLFPKAPENHESVFANDDEPEQTCRTCGNPYSSCCCGTRKFMGAQVWVVVHSDLGKRCGRVL